MSENEESEDDAEEPYVLDEDELDELEGLTLDTIIDEAGGTAEPLDEAIDGDEPNDEF
jgi:hypothetical protein